MGLTNQRFSVSACTALRWLFLLQSSYEFCQLVYCFHSNFTMSVEANLNDSLPVPNNVEEGLKSKIYALFGAEVVQAFLGK